MHCHFSFIQTKIVSYGADGVMVNPPAELGLKSETDCTTCTVKWEVSVHNQNYIMAPWLGYQPIKDSPVYFEGRCLLVVSFYVMSV